MAQEWALDTALKQLLTTESRPKRRIGFELKKPKTLYPNWNEGEFSERNKCDKMIFDCSMSRGKNIYHGDLK